MLKYTTVNFKMLFLFFSFLLISSSFLFISSSFEKYDVITFDGHSLSFLVFFFLLGGGAEENMLNYQGDLMP